MAEPLLTKDSINIAGHKFPIALMGALAAIVGVLVVMRARRAGSNVAGAGSPQSAPGYGSLGPSSFAPDPSAALANLSQQITGIQQDLAAQRQQQQAPPAGPPPPFPIPNQPGPKNLPLLPPGPISLSDTPGDVGYWFGPNPGQSGGPGFPGPGYSWAWRWTDAYAAATGLSNAPQFGVNPGSPGGPGFPGPAFSWEWTWLQKPGDLLSAPGGPDYIGPAVQPLPR